MRITIDIEDDAIEQGGIGYISKVLHYVAMHYVYSRSTPATRQGSMTGPTDNVVAQWQADSGHKVVMAQNPAEKS